ncbi:hypothetical protein ACS0TY_022819 [Phlomoides rotata]
MSERRRIIINTALSEEMEQAAPPEQAPEEVPPHVEMNEDEESDEDGVLRGPYLGGSEDPSLLPSFKSHVAAKIWNGEEHELLKIHCHTTKLLERDIPTDETTRQWRDLFRDTEMLALRDFAYPSPNKALIGAFIERWHP